jgi:subtilisin family serine protease
MPPGDNAHPVIPVSKQQPKRILGIMPNYRAVSAGAIPPPPTPKQAFKIATQNSFDYSSFMFVGVTSLLAEATNAHPALGKGVGGYGEYYWRGFVDKTDGNYLVIFALPTILHQDTRYFAMGDGGFVKRGTYAASRIFITPNYHGHNTFNAPEIFGRGIAQAISTTYYPSKDRTAGEIAEKYAFALARDALTNTFREFWPESRRQCCIGTRSVV